MAKNSIDLSNLPTKYGKIDWQKCDSNIVPFVYRGTSDYLIVIKHINQDLILINYHDNIMEFQKESLKKCVLGKLFNFATKDNYKYQVGDILVRPNGETFTILEQIRDSKGTTKLHPKAYIAKCSKCNCTFPMREGNIDKGYNCPVCKGRKVGVGYNDLWSANPELSKWLTNPNDGYLYTIGSNKYVNFTCLYCKTDLGPKEICTVYKQGLSCPVCGRHKSYPNKFMYNLLSELHCDFDNEVKFPWCTFFDYDGVATYGIYDFVIESQKLIIEMDGGLGHGNNIFGKSQDKKLFQDKAVYRDNQKDKLAIEHGYKVVHIDCNYYGSKDKFITTMNGVLASEFASIYDLSNIDFKQIDRMCYKHPIEEICRLYNDGYSSSKISEIINMDLSCVIDYLHKGNELQLCKYIPHKNKRRKF